VAFYMLREFKLMTLSGFHLYSYIGFLTWYQSQVRFMSCYLLSMLPSLPKKILPHVATAAPTFSSTYELVLFADLFLHGKYINSLNANLTLER
jgi:hypothetical protein